MSDQFQNIQDWATGDAGEGEPALPVSDIRANVEADIAALGTMAFSLDDIPDSATARPNGVFLSYDDLYQYLENGGLVFLNPDTGKPTPNPIVHIFAYVDNDDFGIEYEVWIDENS